MKKVLLMSALLSLIACSKTSEDSSSKSSKEMVILALDISQSHKSPSIPPLYIKELCKSLEQRSEKATVIIYPIGNPSSKVNTITCDIEGFVSKTKAITLSQRRDNVLRKRKVSQENEKLVKSFTKEYENNIFSIRRTSHTAIKQFNKWLYLLTLEERYKGHSMTLFFYSDGIQSIKGVDEFYPLNKTIEGLSIYTCGLEESARPFTQPFSELTSYQSFFHLFKI